MARKPKQLITDIQGSADFTPVLIEAAGKEPAKRPAFTMMAYAGGQMRLSGWHRPVVVDLAGLKAAPSVSILKDHDPTQLVGQASEVTIDATGIKVKATITGDETASPTKDILVHATNGFRWPVSIGAQVDRIEYVDPGAKASVNGQQFSGPINIVRAGVLREVSFVGVGADENASASVSAASGTGTGDSNMEFNEWLQAKGFEPDQLTEKGRATLKAQYDAEQKPAPKAAPAPKVEATAGSIDEVLAAAEARRARTAKIAAMIEEAARNGADVDELRVISAKAVESNMDLRDLELSLMRLTRGKPFNIGQTSNARGADMLQAAALMTCGHDGNQLVKEVGEQAVEAADRNFRGGIGLQELILQCAQANGYRGRDRVTAGNWRELVGWASKQDVTASAGFTSASLPTILGNVANKAMAKMAADPVWLAPRICGAVSHSNFHSHTVAAMGLVGDAPDVAPGGELAQLRAAEATYTRQVGTKGFTLRISRQDVVNDDLGVFNSNARELARKMFTAREKAVFVKICASGAGASHFTAARGNYVTGATSALSTTGLDLAVKAFRKLTDTAGDYVMVEPSILLVPSTLEGTARRLLATASALIATDMSATADVQGPNANIYAGRFGGEPLVSPWLEKTTITGHSAAYYYLFADPSVLPCYEISYLNGQQSPTVNYFGLEADADTLGMAWQTFWDFGVDSAIWQAGVKVAGA